MVLYMCLCCESLATFFVLLLDACRIPPQVYVPHFLSCTGPRGSRISNALQLQMLKDGTLFFIPQTRFFVAPQEQASDEGLQGTRWILPGLHRGTGGHSCAKLHQEGDLPRSSLHSTLPYAPRKLHHGEATAVLTVTARV